MADPAYGWFQSLLQLSVGTNLTFAVILSLFDYSIKKERDIASNIHISATNIIGMQFNTEDNQNRALKVYERSQTLKNSVDSWGALLEYVSYYIFRPIALLMSLLALYLLIESSIYNDRKATFMEMTLSFITITPFLVFSVWAIGFSYYKAWQTKRLRRELDDSLSHIIPSSP
ncbi:hypothetical protein [Bosea sp. BH3]|uniref:hypothetical protein n=1 Tax=Bosea sp. BH3 TaxID=2871701 RepID=UPI0021CB1C42|nr:hypothetical protein [Bosea sp. BH3]MCU4182370.1 hypothetical protein [Bosea sp. BH3]